MSCTFNGSDHGNARMLFFRRRLLVALAEATTGLQRDRPTSSTVKRRPNDGKRRGKVRCEDEFLFRVS